MATRTRERLEHAAIRVLRRAGSFYQPYAERMRPYIGPYIYRAQARYQRLEPREKILVQIAGALIGVFLAYNLVYSPFEGLRQDLSDRTETRARQISEVRRMVHQYRQLSLEVAAAEKRTVRQTKDFSLFSAVEGKLTETVGVVKVSSITPGEDQKISKDLVQHNVEIALANLTLQEVVDTLYGIDTLPVPVLVSDLHIKRTQLITTSFDVQMTCVAIGKSG
jgi:type II secretory pathway component PulM